MVALAVDVSNYTGEISQEVLEKWKARGVILVMVQAIAPPLGYPPQVEQQQAEAVLAAGGLALGCYGFHWTGTDLAKRNIQRFANYNYPVYRYAGDFEDEAPASPFQREQEIADLLAWLATLQAAQGPLSYTGMYYADYLPPNSQCMAGYGQWIANYNAQETLDDTHTICGATNLVMKQHIGSITFEGQPGVDLSVLSAEEEFNVLKYLGLATEPVVEQPALPDPDAPARETPDDWPWPTWYEAAINYKAIADELGRQLVTARCLRQAKSA